MQNKTVLSEKKESIYHKQITIMWMYFKALPNEETRDEFMSFLSMINNLSQKSYSIQEIKQKVIECYAYSQNAKDIEHIVKFANAIKNIKSAALKDRLVELVESFKE